ncbi:TonB-dependent siderophore receptor [Sphingomonas fuzhouensis]|uniref:TonB-dependent siderophore receptor n=1 Tax=Sphingomonas fuzhouensis TaxID=3106033 RepID=UPI002AFFA873|nr:TonB-dependent siderophore receptor [Sphingomonas sp. SGZ-02]
MTIMAQARAFAGATLMGMGLANPAVALADTTREAPVDASETAESQEVTVTGLRQQYRGDVPLRELPQSVQILSADKLAEAGVTRLDDALDFASAVSRQNNFGGLFDSFAIRGFAGDEGTSSSYLLNGFNASRGYGGIRDTSNVERIEILKGPSSALFGRGEPGGTINIITKKPLLDHFAAGMTAGYGSFNRFRGEADINAPITDGLGVRVTGAYDEGDSFRDFVHSRKYTVTPSILFRPAPDTSLSYELEYVHQALPFDRGIAEVNGSPRGLPRSRFLGEPGDGDVTVDALGHQVQLQHDFSRRWSVLLGASYRDTSFGGFSTEAENADARQPYLSNNAVQTGSILSRQRRLRDYQTSDMVFRGEISGRFDTGAFTHHLLLGADYDEYVLDRREDRIRPGTTANALTSAATPAQLRAANAINVFDPVYGNLPTVAPFTNQRERQWSYGVYVQDLVDVTDRLKLRFGGRFDHLERRLDFRIPNAAGRLPLAAAQDNRRFSPQVGLSWEVAQPVTLYASYGKGFRANTGTGAPNAAGAATLFEPEYTQSYEVGAKFVGLGDRLTGTVAAFQTNKTNVLTSDPVNPGFSRSLGRARSRGVEADADLTLPGDLRLSATFAYIDAEVREAAIEPNFGFALRVGDPLINIPKTSGSALIAKDFRIGARTLTLGAGVNYVGRRLGETGYRFPDGSFFELPAYTVARLHGAFDITERVRLSGEITNLFDSHYYPNSYSRLWITPGAPRQFFLRAAVRL